MKNWKLTAVLVVTLLNLALLVGQQFQLKEHARIGIIQMEEVVYNFAGMKAATLEYTQRLETWQAQADTLEKRMTVLLADIHRDSIAGDRKAAQQKKRQLANIRQSYAGYARNINERAAQDDQNLTAGVLNQLNTYVKSFAQEKGYDLILANTQLENIVYAGETEDVTEELLAYANQKYQYGE